MKRIFIMGKKYFAQNQKIIFICTGIILGGTLTTGLLLNITPPPVKKEVTKKILQVEVMTAEKKNYPVFLKAYGEVGSIKVVHISPEISGKVVSIHPGLESGEIIKKGELLFKIDSEIYEATINTGKKRLSILERSCELAQKEYERVKRLFEKNNVGSVSGVDAAEKKWVQDELTGLMWEVKTDENKFDQYTWQNSLSEFIDDLNNNQLGGYSDWRMPTINELADIVDYGKVNPAINTDYFPNTELGAYWSVTSVIDHNYNAWHLDFTQGESTGPSKLTLRYCRAVRDGL